LVNAYPNALLIIITTYLPIYVHNAIQTLVKLAQEIKSITVLIVFLLFFYKTHLPARFSVTQDIPTMLQILLFVASAQKTVQGALHLHMKTALYVKTPFIYSTDNVSNNVLSATTPIF
jgi:hypothetical protein